jgi:hypothetical protein
MMFATPLGLLALLAVPAIVAIHLFRRRFPVRPVAGLFLWQLIRKTPEGGGRIARLPVTTSLILECAAAAALAMILAGARCSPAGLSQHLVVLLDDSASMAAANVAGESARDRGIRRVLDEIERLGAGARLTLVQSGERPSVLYGPAGFAVDAPHALAAWKPEAAHHSLALGLRLSRELAGSTGKLLVVSDVMPAARGEAHFENGLWVATGTPLANAGIVAAQRTFSLDQNRGVVSLTLANNSTSSIQRRLSVSAGDTELIVRELDLPSGVSSLTLPLPAGTPAVRVRLADDSLMRDNEVTLAEPRPQIVGVETHLADGRGRQALLKALGVLSGVTHTGSGHLAFVDAATLDRPAATGVWRVGFGRPPAAWIGTGAPEDFIGPFVLEKRAPLLHGVTLGGVVWSGTEPLAPDLVRPLASTGDRVLIGTVSTPSRSGPGVTILFNLDLDRTNLIRAPDWPILISNVIEMRRQSLPGPERWNYRAGEWVRVRLDRDPKGPLGFRCGGIERSLPAGRQLEFIAPAPCGLLQVIENGETLFEVGVNFLDETETKLAQQMTADAGALADVAGLRAETTAASDPLFWLFLAIASAALMTNWSLVSPRTRQTSRA